VQITGVSLDEFAYIVEHVSGYEYGDNLIVHPDSRDLNGKRAPRIRARVSVKSVGAREGLPVSKTLPGVRRSGSAFSVNKDGYRARVHAACWHAYRDVLTSLFEHFPKAIVRTAMATYEGKDGFERVYPATADRNIGSMAYPVCAADACDCEE
jgi:hypothetical protein